MKKKIVYNSQAKQKLLDGVKALADAVVATLGPRSNNVAINREYPAPLIVHDGVTVARQVRLEDEFADMGATLLREAASKTNDLAGDGTTTATLLAYKLFDGGLSFVGGGLKDGMIVGKANPMKLREDFLQISSRVVDEVKKRAKKLEKEDIKKVALVSSGMENIADCVYDALKDKGADSVVMVEESSGFETYVEHQEGYEFDNGMNSPYFATDPHRMVCEFNDAYLLITDHRISDAYEIVDIVQQVKDEGKKALVIIADEISGPALQTLVLTKLNLGLRVVAINAPEFGDTRRSMLEDIALLTGASPVFIDTQRKLKEVKISDLGLLKSVTVTQTHTTLAPAFPDSDDISEKIEALNKQLKEEDNEFRKSRIEKRIAKLRGGMSIIYAGGATVSERQEIKERVIDAVYACKSALEEGVVAGGGVTLASIATQLETEMSEKYKVAWEIARDALNSPYETILTNAGLEPSKYDLKDGDGVNVITGEAVDMLQEGIVDPVKVVRLGVLHAFSVAAMMLTTNVLITDVKDKENEKI